MKVLFDHHSPFFLAHGGFQIQIEQTKRGLERIGVETDWVRWWDVGQKGDLIHFFGRPPGSYIDFAHGKGMKVVMAELLTGLGSRSSAQRKAQKALIGISRRCLPTMFTARMAWEAYRKADANVALTPWEARLMREMFDAPADRVYVVPNGVEDVFRESAPRKRGSWLVCTATVTERKRVLELATAAVEAKTPLWVIGQPYAEQDPYFKAFRQLHERFPEWLRYEGGIADRQRLAVIYREARGFVLLSTMETLSLSALEGAACECPLLLSDLPWARCTYGDTARYCPVNGTPKQTAAKLAQFYAEAPGLPLPPMPKSWVQIAEDFKRVYQAVL